MAFISVESAGRLEQEQPSQPDHLTEMGIRAAGVLPVIFSILQDATMLS